MEQVILTIKENYHLTSSVMRMELEGDCGAIVKPGQFINIKIEGLYLRRPISVCRYDEKSLTIIYKIVGEGTEKMSKMKSGDTLDCLMGLGNGFDSLKSGDKPLLVGGGVGVPPMYGLCKELISQGKEVSVVLGFNTKEEIFFEEEFKALGAKVYICTVDGSYGIKGFVTDAVKTIDYSYFYTCGPMPMFKALEATVTTSGQYSFEERMGCGFGACMGCSCKTKYKNKRICKDGPVLEREEIVW